MALEKAVFYYADSLGREEFLREEELVQRGLSLDFYCHSLHYAKGIFDGIRGVYGKNPKGLHLITLDEHLERLKKSSEFVGLLKINTEKLKQSIKELIGRNIRSGFLNPEEGCYVRPLVFSDKKFDAENKRVPGMGVYSGKHQKTMIIGLFPWGNYLEGGRIRVFEEGVFDSMRKIKACGNYLFNGVAKDRAVNEGYDEALITDPFPERNVLEGGGENVFLFRKSSVSDYKTVATPDIGQSILPGTKRKVLIEMLGNYGVKAEERKIPLDEFMEGSGAVFTGTAAGVFPLQSVYDPITNKEQAFDSNYSVIKGLTLTDLAEEYQLIIAGEKVDRVNRELQKKIRTFVD